MSGRTHSWAVALLGGVGMLMVPAAIVAGVVLGAGAPDRPHDPPRVVVPIGDGAGADRAMSRADDGAAVDPLAAHQAMLEQMRVNVTPQMLQTMNANPLTHSPGDLAEMERHATDIDRMLGRTP